jgi:hypothetical protein
MGMSVVRVDGQRLSDRIMIGGIHVYRLGLAPHPVWARH